MSASVMDLVKKFCPGALTMFKDPTKLMATITKLTPMLESALKMDPKSVQGKANSLTDQAGATAAKTEKKSLKDQYLNQKTAQSLYTKAGSLMQDQIKKKIAQAAAHQAPLLKQSLNALNSQLASTKSVLLKASGVMTDVAGAQKDLTSANRSLSQASIVKIPNVATGTIANKAKSLAAIAKAVQEVNKNVQTAITKVKSAQTKATAVQKNLPPVQAQLATSIPQLQQTMTRIQTQLNQSVATARHDATTR